MYTRYLNINTYTYIYIHTTLALYIFSLYYNTSTNVYIYIITLVPWEHWDCVIFFFTVDMSFLRFLHSGSRSSSCTQSAAMYDLTSSSAFKLSSLVSSVLMRSLAYSSRPWISSHGCRTLISVTWCRSEVRSTICASMLLLRSSKAPITSGMPFAALSRLMSAQLFSTLCFLVAGVG